MAMANTEQLSIKQDTLHVWYARIDVDQKNKEQYHSLLSTDERERARKFHFEKDRVAFIAARGILRKLSGYYLNTNPTAIRFNYSSHGKPSYAVDTNLKFNISHSGNMAAFAFGHAASIGVDIEKIKHDFDPIDLASGFFSKEEITALKNRPNDDQQRAFFRCWTRKESFIKAEGSGLSFPLNLFAVSLENDSDAALLKTHWDLSERTKWQLVSFVPAKGYLGALAIKGEPKQISYFNLDEVNFV